MGFSKQEYGSGLPFLSPGDLPDPGIKTGSPALYADSLPSESPGSPRKELISIKSKLLILKELSAACPHEMVGWHHRLNGHGFGWTPVLRGQRVASTFS